ncbi:MAG: hypothetical protein ACJ8AI_35165, partial [Rhodopila sp.]
GPDKPGHDDGGTFPTIPQALDFAVVSEMCELGRAKPGHDQEAMGRDAKSFSICHLILMRMGCAPGLDRVQFGNRSPAVQT